MKKIELISKESLRASFKWQMFYITLSIILIVLSIKVMLYPATEDYFLEKYLVSGFGFVLIVLVYNFWTIQRNNRVLCLVKRVSKLKVRLNNYINDNIDAEKLKKEVPKGGESDDLYDKSIKENNLEIEIIKSNIETLESNIKFLKLQLETNLWRYIIVSLLRPLSPGKKLK